MPDVSGTDMHLEDRYYEDWTIGESLETGALRLDEAKIVAFGRDYDPQPFHVDAEAARHSVFGRLIASGWQTAAITMRLIVDSGIFGRHGGIGMGVDELRWLKPVFAGDTLRVRSEAVSARTKPASKSGIVHFKMTTFNQHDEPVMTQTAIVRVPRRPDSAT
jgi:acyl dehydratase